MAYEASTTLPTPDHGAAGSGDTVSLLSETAASLNMSHARNVDHPISQGFRDEVGDHTGGIAEAARWRIPILSTSHSTLRIYLDAAAHAGSGGTISFHSGANSVSQAVGGARNRYTLDLTLDTSSDHTDVIMKWATPTGADTVRVYEIDSCVRALSTPLPGARVRCYGSNYYTPIGTALTAADAPISAALGGWLISNVVALRARPRTLLCWSGVSPTVAGTDSRDTRGPYGAPSVAISRDGAMQAGVEYQVWVHARNALISNRVITISATALGSESVVMRRDRRARRVIDRGERREWPSFPDDHTSIEIVIPAASAAAWYQSTIKLRGGTTATARRMIKHVRIGVAQNPPYSDLHGSAELLSVSVWGE